MKKHRIVLTGGGTGGHIYPALSVYEQLVKDQSVEAILYIGAKGHIEEALARDRNIQFCGLQVSGMPRRLGFKTLVWPLQTACAIIEAGRILGRFDPSVVLGTGGYASAAPLVAALQLRVPVAVHEPDAHPGLVNKLFARSAKLVSLGMEGALSQIGKVSGVVVVNGNPVRSSFSEGPGRDESLTALGLEPGVTTLAITGGSQGAKAINDVVAQILPGLLKGEVPVQVIHQAGQKNIDELKAVLPAEILENSRYVLRPYFEDMALVYKASDLVIARAGAMTIAELAVSGTPAIFIPYPYAAQNHQMHNARFLEKSGAARVIDQGELTAELLSGYLMEILSDKKVMESMTASMRQIGKPRAAHDLARQLTKLSEQYLMGSTVY